MSVKINRNLTKNIRIVIPKVLKIEEEVIILQKYKEYGNDLMAGEVLFLNMKLANGKRTLITERARQMIEELEQYLIRV